jgi:hypothetical protein
MTTPTLSLLERCLKALTESVDDVNESIAQLPTYKADYERRLEACSSQLNEHKGCIKDLEAAIAAERKEQAKLKIVTIEEPDYHYEAMGCGLEDREIIDRYEAMRYGWDCCVEKFLEQIPDEPIYTGTLEQAKPQQENFDKLAALGWQAVECSICGSHAMAYPQPLKPLSDADLLGAIARGWCHDENARKTMDSDLALAIAEEVKNAIEAKLGVTK